MMIIDDELMGDETDAHIPAPLSPFDHKLPIGRVVSTEVCEEINRFLLCVLVSRSAKRIKTKAEGAGEKLSMTRIVRNVLRRFRLAALENPALLNGSALSDGRLRDLCEKILKDEVARQTQERVHNGRARLARANDAGDDKRIKVEIDALTQALATQDRLARVFK